MKIQIIGSGDKDSYPKEDCICNLCQEARKREELKRLPFSSILIKDKYLIDGNKECLEVLKSKPKEIIITHLFDLETDKEINYHIPEIFASSLPQGENVYYFSNKILFKDILFRCFEIENDFALGFKNFFYYLGNWRNEKIFKTIRKEKPKIVFANGSNLLEKQNSELTWKRNLLKLSKIGVKKVIFLRFSHKNQNPDEFFYNLFSIFPLEIHFARDYENL